MSSDELKVLDELAIACEYWKKNRDNGDTPVAIRDAIVFAAGKLTAAVNIDKFTVYLKKTNSAEGALSVLGVSGKDGFSSLCSWGDDASRQDIVSALRRLADTLES